VRPIAIAHLPTHAQRELVFLKKLITGLPITTSPVDSAITITTEEKDGKTSKTLTVELSKSGAIKGAAIGGMVAGPAGAAAGALLGAVLGKSD
jgi:hypothetical protein